jgi:cytochrome c oxidase assembly factor CtaG
MVTVVAVASSPLPPLSVMRTLTAWRFAPGVVAVAGGLVGGYGAGVRRWQASGKGPWPRSRTWCFGLGVLVLLLVGCSFVGVYDDTLFWVRAVQNIVLLMVVPMFLAVGAPLTLFASAVSPPVRTRLSRALHSRPAVVVTLPLVVTVVLVVPILVLYMSPIYEATLRDPVVSGVAGTALVVAGFVYFWTRFRIDPTPRPGSHLVTLAITIVEVVGDAVLGVVVWLGPLIAAGFYTALNRQWGPDLRTDQLLGAGVLWVGGDVVGLPFIGIVLARMVREDEEHARIVDAVLDRGDAGPTSAGAEELPGAGAAAEPGSAAGRLWWEDDPQLADRFRHPR